jgi:CelD/BcsL family acetyltransferase involved in cellulose biosynthesis
MQKPMPEISCISTTDDFRHLRDEWNALNDISEKGTLFSSWEWLFSWWEIYQNDAQRKLYILCYREQGVLHGIAPFQILDYPKKQFPCSKQLIFLGTGETDGGLVLTEYLDLIVTPTKETDVINAFSNTLMQEQRHWQGALFKQLLPGSLLSNLFAGQRLSISIKNQTNGFRTLIDLPDTYKNYLMSLRKKKRNNITRMLTRLESEQDFTIDTIRADLDIDVAITELAELNRERRGQLEQPSAFHQANFEAFHRLVVKRLLPLNKVELRILRIEEKAVAALYSLIDGDTMHAYQSGFEAELGHRYALLTMMITSEISNCIDHPKLKRFNFMYSADENSYKLRYSAYTEPMLDISFFPRNTRSKIHNFIHGPVKEKVKTYLKRKTTA